MKTKIKVSILALTSLFFSCKTAKPIEQEQHQKIIETIIRDTVVELQADSTFYRALIECKNGKPILIEKNLKDTKTKFKESLKINTALSNGILTVNCKQEAKRLFLQWKEKHIRELNNKTIIMPPKLVKKPLTWWEVLWCSLGKFFSGVFFLWMIFKAVQLWKRLAVPLP
ncbi:hypothetical protein ACUXZJ_07135 [Flavobacterium sp. TN-1]